MMQIWLYDDLVGSLQSDRSGQTIFVPELNWTRSNQIPRLGLRFLENSSPKSSTGLPVWFENLLPERNSELRRYFNTRFGNPKNSSSLLLAHLGQDLPGAVRAVGGEVDENPVDEHPSNHRFSLAGMQLKFSMRHVSGRFISPAEDAQGEEWILKHPGQIDGLVENELAMMEWARACGFDVPETRMVAASQIDQGLFTLDQKDIFAIKRYDRTPEGRIHQEDFAQAFFKAPDSKYEGTYEELTRMVRDACDTETAMEFARRVIFTVVSGNGDAHLKNWSFVWSQGALKPVLAPLYDQVCTIAVPGFGYATPTPLNPRPVPPELALSIGKVRAFPELNSDAMATYAKRSDLDLEELRAMAIKIRDSIPTLSDDLSGKLTIHWQRTPWLRAIF